MTIYPCYDTLKKGKFISFYKSYQVRLIQECDLLRIITMHRNPNVTKYAFFSSSTDEMYKQYFTPFIENTKNALEKNIWPDNVVVVMYDNDNFIGFSALCSQVFLEGNYEIGYALNEEYWGNGIATAICKFMTQLVFSTLSCHKCIADCFKDNIGSVRVLEKSGYIQEGCLKGYYKQGNEYKDKLFYGMTKDEYNQISEYNE